MSEIHHRACNLCEAICGVAIEHEAGRVVAIRGDKDDPFSRGHICPKALSLGDIHHDPDRLKRPLRRKGGDWEEVAWDDAFDDIAARITAISRAHGRDAVGVYQGNPIVHNYGSMLYGMIALPTALRTRSRFSSQSIDNLPRMFVSRFLFGNQAVLPIPDLDRTSYFLVFGANPLVSNGSIMTAPDVGNRLAALRARGGKLVVIDPRRSETAAIADEHHFVRPGRDALVLLGMLHTILGEKLERPGRLGPMIDGLEEVRALAARYAPERTAAHTGIAAAEIRRLARELAAAPSAVCYGRMGVSVQEFGALSTWLIDVLNVVTGNLDRPGGAMFTTPAIDVAALAARADQRGGFGRWKTRVRGLPEFNGELPVAALAEEIDTPGPGQIRALITSCGNPVLSAPNGRRLDAALAGLDLMVSIDIYLNETTRHATYVLPPTFALEHEHYDVALHAVAIRNTTKWSPALFPPEPGALHDWQIYVELMARLSDGALGGVMAGLIGLAGRRITPERVVDLLIRTGPYGDKLNPFSRGLSLQKIKDSVHGIDLGPLQPRLPELLYTDGHRIHLAPKEITIDLVRLDARLLELEAIATTPAGAALSLIGRRELRSNNSWGHNTARMMKGRERCTLLMHPEDAQARGLADGAQVRIRSRIGEIEAPLEVSAEVMRGVVSLPHGYGHDRAGVRLGVAQQRPGTSVNDITDDALVDALCGNASVNGVAVEVLAT